MRLPPLNEDYRLGLFVLLLEVEAATRLAPNLPLATFSHPILCSSAANRHPAANPGSSRLVCARRRRSEIELRR